MPYLGARGRSATLTTSGVRLGSVTAQLASKSFWNDDMLRERVKQIAHALLQEKSAQNPQADSYDEVNQRRQKDVAQREGDHFRERELRSPCVCLGESGVPRHGYRTPPYLSPGATQRIRRRDDMFFVEK